MMRMNDERERRKEGKKRKKKIKFYETWEGFE